MSAVADVGLWVMIAKGAYDFFSYVRERRQARKHPVKACPPPVPTAKPKQKPTRDGKR